MNLYRTILIGIGIFTLSICTMAQTKVLEPIPYKCGTLELPKELQLRSEEELLKYQSFLKKYRKSQFTKDGEMDTVSVKLNILRSSDGGELTSMEDILNGLDFTNSKYNQAGIHFSVCPTVRYIDDSSLQPFERDFEEGIITPEDLDINAVNIFYVGSFKEEGLAGYFTQNPVGYYIIMGSTSGPTLAHELGHYYGLAHTHGMYNSEPPDYEQENPMENGFPYQVYIEGAVRYIDESKDDNDNSIFDCHETGDGICDTPAEPVRLGGQDHHNPITCEYFGTLTDFYGDSYQPNPGNIMSYGFCFDFDEYFTGDQYARIRFNLDRDRVSELCGFCGSESEDRIVTNTNDGGKGSLLWALECNNRKDGVVNVRFQLEESSSRVINLGESFIRVDGNEIDIDGKDITSGEKVEIEGSRIFLFGDKVILKNIVIRGVPTNYGLSLQQVNGEVDIDNIEIYNSANGIFAKSLSNLKIRNSIIANNSGTGIVTSDVGIVELHKNKIHENDEGVRIFATTQILTDNNVYCNLTSDINLFWNIQTFTPNYYNRK